MPDMVFYNDKKLYVFYNKIWPKQPFLTFDDSLQIFCYDYDDKSNKKTWLQPIFGEITPELEGSGSGSLHVTGSQDITVQDLTLLREGADPVREFVGIANPLSLDEAADKNTKAYQGRLRYGDIDQNGFPDIFITL